MNDFAGTHDELNDGYNVELYEFRRKLLYDCEDRYECVSNKRVFHIFPQFETTPK